MRNVISASRRTDLPAFYTPWLLERFEAGYADVQNPFRAGQVRRIGLKPEDVAWIVFWSRNYRVWLRHREAFREYRTAFHFTITTGHPLLEPGVPSVDDALDQAETLARLYGGERLFWRYDPIVCWCDSSGAVLTNHDDDVFERLCRELGSFGVRQCTISFAHFYPSVRRRMARLRPPAEPVDPDTAARHRFVEHLRDVAGAHRITLAACCTEDLLQVAGVAQAHCIDGALLTRLGGEAVSTARSSTRAGCGCTKSIDIGDYNAHRCGYDCLYCYASPSLRRFRSY